MANELMAMDQNLWESAKKQCAMVANVPGFLYYKKPAEAMLVAMKAHDMGLSFSEALEQVFVVNGRTAIQGQLMLSRIRKAGHEIKFKEVGPKKVTIEAKRKEEKEPTLWSYTIEEAQQAGLLRKNTWQQYPADMLSWRVVARAARFQFSDVIGGTATLPEEIGADEPTVSFKPLEETRSELTDVFTAPDEVSLDDVSKTKESEEPHSAGLIQD